MIRTIILGSVWAIFFLATGVVHGGFEGGNVPAQTEVVGAFHAVRSIGGSEIRSAYTGSSTLGRIVVADTQPPETLRDGYVIAPTYTYGPFTVAVSKLRVRRGERVEMTWNTHGRSLCHIESDFGDRYPKKGMLDGLFGTEPYLDFTGRVNPRIERSTTFSFICRDPGRTAEWRGEWRHDVRINLAPPPVRF